MPESCGIGAGSRNVFDQDSVRGGFDLVVGNRQIAQETLLGHEYASPLSAPPSRGDSDIIDPWSAGRDPWVQGPSLTLAERYRGRATSTPTASFTEKYRTHRSRRRPRLQRLCSRHLRPRMKLFLLVRPLWLMMLLGPLLCAQVLDFQTSL